MVLKIRKIWYNYNSETEYGRKEWRIYIMNG